MTDWGARYDAGDTPWDKGEAAPPLVDFLRESPFASGAEVLVPGCGRGHEVRLLAREGCAVLGMDIAEQAVSQARAFPVVANERYCVEDFLNLPSRYHGSFDAVVEHTCFCAIQLHQREAYVRAAAAALRKGGVLVGVFFTHIDDAGDGPPRPCAEAELDSLFEPYFICEYATTPVRTFASRAQGCREQLRLMRLR